MEIYLNGNKKTGLLLLTVTRGVEIIDVNTIVRIEASSNYSRIYFADGQKLVSSKILKWFETHLPPQLFVRVHRKHLTNKKFICNYNHGNRRIFLSSGESIQVSRRKKEDFMRYWQNTSAIQ